MSNFQSRRKMKLIATALLIVEVANALKWTVCGNHDERHEDRRR